MSAEVPQYIQDAIARFADLENKEGRIDAALIAMFGAEPEALVLRQADAFSITTDMRPLLRAVGGKWAALVERVEAEEAERRKNTLSSQVTRDELDEKWRPSVPGNP